MSVFICSCFFVNRFNPIYFIFNDQLKCNIIVMQFSDGYLDVIIVKDSPKSALLGMMLRMGDGSYAQSPYVMYFKVC